MTREDPAHYRRSTPCIQGFADNFTYLLQDGPDDFQWQRTKFVLLKKVIKVLLQHLKNQTGVTAMLKAL